jgi:hypothetical protein
MLKFAEGVSSRDWHPMCNFAATPLRSKLVTRPSLRADHWFQLLDGRWIRSEGQICTLAVDGVHVDGEDVWIQLSRGTHDANILVHVRAPATIQDVLIELEHSPLNGHQQIDVSRAA